MELQRQLKALGGPPSPWTSPQSAPASSIDTMSPRSGLLYPAPPAVVFMRFPGVTKAELPSVVAFKRLFLVECPPFYSRVPLVAVCSHRDRRAAAFEPDSAEIGMLVRDLIGRELERKAPAEPPDVKLPAALNRAGETARTGILRRLAASRRFAFGDRTGASGRWRFRLDVSQRVIVKALVSRHGQGARPGGALARHIAYLGRAGAGHENERPTFFDSAQNELNPSRVAAAWGGDRHHFRLIVSPEHGDRISDLRSYVRGVMGKVATDQGEPRLVWLATCHFDTDQPHAHVLVRGRRADGRDLVIARDYISNGIRARAQAAAQELLGDLSRPEAESRVWRQTQANRFTQLDRRLLAQASSERMVADGVGRSDAWSALTRGRLRHLESLGLAHRLGNRYRLSPDLERSLRAASLRMDIIRTLNQRRLEGARDVRSQTLGRVTGEVMASGFHDEIGAAGYVVVRAADGVEHYGALLAGASPPRLGQHVVVDLSLEGAANLTLQRGADLAL